MAKRHACRRRRRRRKCHKCMELLDSQIPEHNVYPSVEQCVQIDDEIRSHGDEILLCMSRGRTDLQKQI